MADAHSGEVSLRILVVDDEQNIRMTLAMCLEAEGHTAIVCSGIDEALEQVSRQVFDLIFLDVRLGMHNGLEYLSTLIADCPWTKVVVITAFASVTTAVKAMKLGATDYLPKPFTPAQVQLVMQKVAERRRMELQIDALQSTLGAMDPEADLYTENAQMRRALEMARQVAPSNTTLLICGEVGAGKGRLARAIHAWSPRAAAPFAAVSCDTTTADELDAELFGLTRDDANPPVDMPGRIELAQGGTLALHDIARIPPSLQPKILRFLTEREFERHDDFKARKGDVRVVASSSVDPAEAVKAGRLRSQLLLALDVIRIEIPPLRNRPEDIRMLARRYVTYFSRENHRPIAGISNEAINALKKYFWPGNTRELRNLIERAVLLCQADEVGLEHLPPNLLNGAAKYGIGDLVSLDTIEDLHIQRVLDSTGSIKGAAAVLGIGLSTMVRWMKRAKVAIPVGDAAEAATVGVGDEKSAS